MLPAVPWHHHAGVAMSWCKVSFRTWDTLIEQKKIDAVFSDLQVPDVKWLLVHVDGVGARRQAAHGRQVTAITSHGLYDEDPALGAAGRLFDAVTRLTNTRYTVNTILNIMDLVTCLR